jgi:hypothetical protein
MKSPLQLEATVSKKARATDEIVELEVDRQKYRLDRQLDRELEDTFPASDAPKITRTPHHVPNQTTAASPGSGSTKDYDPATA